MKSIAVPETFYAYIKAHNRAEETMGETLIRLVGGPHPSAIESTLSEETADATEKAIRDRASSAKKGRTDAAEQFASDEE